MADVASSSGATYGSWRSETLATLALGWPMILTNLVEMALTTTDVMLMGRLGPQTLAAGILATNLFFGLAIPGLGVVTAVSPLIAKERGGRPHAVREVRRTVRQGLWSALLLSVIALLVLSQTEWILRALGQVVVFVDEADQASGRREGGDGDSGLSGRVYSMLAKEMSDTRNRGRILWVFATSRPDLVEVDLKRQGRLDVHIPLFPPETAGEREALLLAIAKKLKLPLTAEDLPPFTDDVTLGGNELEGVLVRALRVHELSPEPRKPLREVLAEVIKDVRPNPHTRKLEYMDLVAVKECTDVRFLPPHYRELTPEELETRIDALRRFV